MHPGGLHAFVRFAIQPRLSLLFLWFVFGCNPQAESPCPHGTTLNTSQAHALRAQLSRSTAGKSIANHPRSKTATICFGPVQESTINDNGVIALNDQLTSSEGVARLAHLLLHWSDNTPMVEGKDCDLEVDQALRREAIALHLEFQLRAELGTDNPTHHYAVEQDWRRALPNDPIEFLHQHLRSHPQGSPGLTSLGQDYQRRCQQLMTP